MALIFTDGKGEGSAEEAVVGVFVDHPEGIGQSVCLGARLVAVPSAVAAFPEDAPGTLGVHILHPGDRLLDLFTETLESGAHQEKFNGLVREPLALADLVTKVQRRTPSGPK
jgi:hypothetical protein